MASAVLTNIRQVVLFLQGRGWHVSYGKVKADVERGALRPRRGGGFTESTALAYAQNHITRRELDATPAADAPLVAESQSGGAAERRTSADAELKEVAAMRARLAFAREMGRYTETVIIDDELAARAKAFRLGLEKFGIDAAESVAALFGGTGETAHELAQRLGLEGEALEQAVPVIVDFAYSQCIAFSQMWQEKIEMFLDPYSNNTWWTEAMRIAWEQCDEHSHLDVPAVQNEASHE